MKKLILSVLAIAGMLVAMAAFHACSSDEADEQNLTQAQLLMQKSKEFAKKYGVNMTLNEENIEETAKTLTVEQMEKIYESMSQLCIKIPIQKSNNKFAKTKNKLRIRKVAPLLEIDRPDPYQGSASGSASNDVLGIRIAASCSWTYSEKGAQHVSLTITYQHNDCNDSQDRHYTPHFYTANDYPTFEIKDNIKLSCPHFSVTASVKMTEKEVEVKF